MQSLLTLHWLIKIFYHVKAVIFVKISATDAVYTYQTLTAMNGAKIFAQSLLMR